jgi:hypothetical protein
VTSLIDLGHPEKDTELCEKISCPVEALTRETIKDYRGRFEAKVSEDTRKEIAFLLELLDRNGLFAFGKQAVKIADANDDYYSGYESEGDMYRPFAELYIERQSEV